MNPDKDGVVEVGGEPCFPIAEAARRLGRSRPTLMRWVSKLKRVTGHAAQQDATGRWFFPRAAVERLQGDGAMLKRLATLSSNGNGDGELARVVRDVSALKKKVSQLRADVDAIKDRARSA